VDHANRFDHSVAGVVQYGAGDVACSIDARCADCASHCRAYDYTQPDRSRSPDGNPGSNVDSASGGHFCTNVDLDRAGGDR
jgi:hypothetical protein